MQGISINSQSLAPSHTHLCARRNASLGETTDRQDSGKTLILGAVQRATGCKPYYQTIDYENAGSTAGLDDKRVLFLALRVAMGIASGETHDPRGLRPREIFQ